MRLSLLLAASAAALLTACSGEKPAAPAAAAPKAAIGAFGIDTTAMDAAVKPGDDFYKYVNGKWLATYQMPADKTRFGAFDILREGNEDLRGLPLVERRKHLERLFGASKSRTIRNLPRWCCKAK